MGARGGGAILLCLAMLTACSPSSVSSSPSPVPNPAAHSAATGPDLIREATHPDPNFDFGYTIQITPAGLLPHWLVSNCCQPITWRNQTQAPASVVFEHGAAGSGLIPPGGTFVFTPPHIESLSYHLGSDPPKRGIVQVNQTAE